MSTTKRAASSALFSFLGARHSQAPKIDTSRALRRKKRRQQQKSKQSHGSSNRDTENTSDRKVLEKTNLSSNKDDRRTETSNLKTNKIRKEERDIRRRIIQMRENKRKGKAIIPSKSTNNDIDSDDEF